MQDTLTAPIDFAPNYQIKSNRMEPQKRDKMIGFGFSLLAHIGLLTFAGLAFVKQADFRVNQGMSGMEVQLVAGVSDPQPIIEEVKEEPVITEDKIVIPQEAKKPEPVIEEKKTLGNAPIDAPKSEGALKEAQPMYLKNPAPAYPLRARQNGWEGLVVLRTAVDKIGNPITVEIERSSGYDSLDQAALKTVKTWKFRPAMLGNFPVESSVKVPVRFQIKDAGRTK